MIRAISRNKAIFLIERTNSLKYHEVCSNEYLAWCNVSKCVKVYSKSSHFILSDAVKDYSQVMSTVKKFVLYFGGNKK